MFKSIINFILDHSNKHTVICSVLLLFIIAALLAIRGFVNACFSKGRPAGRPIVAGFANGSTGEYTTEIFDLLKSDPATVYIYDAETGEIIYTKN